MTTKYCSSCNSTRTIEGGQIVSFRSSDGAIRTRWRCHVCVKAAQNVNPKLAKVFRPV